MARPDEGGGMRIGEVLKGARTRQGLDIGTVEERTKIRTKYLRALEAEDWERLPSPAYAKGFLRTYSNLLGLDADAIVDRIDAPEVLAAYEADKAETRSASGSPAEAQGKTSTSDGPVRFTAPSVVFERDGQRLVAGGWQHVLAYDVLLANLDPTLERKPPPETPGPLLECFPDGLTTVEVALLLADGPDPVPDRDAAERALVELVAEGAATRTPLGQDALWRHA
jgi:hypothetical protein